MSHDLLEQFLHSFDSVSIADIGVNDAPIEVVKLASSNPDEMVWRLDRPCPSYPLENQVSTVDEFIATILRQDSHKRAFGYREVLAKCAGHTELNTPVEKMKLADEYTWFTRAQVNEMIENVSNGLSKCGVAADDLVTVILDTRYEWFIASQAIFRVGAAVATMSPTSSLEDTVDCINKLQSTHLITSSDLLPKMLEIKRQVASLSSILVVDNIVNYKIDKWPIESIENTKLIRFSSLLDASIGKPEKQFKGPNGESLALIVYTSGSTGASKGVQYKHKDLLAAVFNVGRATLNGMGLERFPEDRTFPAYLPYAHLFQTLYDLILLGLGFKIGFARPTTLLSSSPGLAEGTESDLALLKPHYMICVTIILKRVRTQVLEKLQKEQSRQLFDYLLDYKKNMNSQGKATGPADQYIASKVLPEFGGNMKALMVSSAPLPRELKFFIFQAGIKISELYGSTETIAQGAMDIPRSRGLSLGMVFPAPGCLMKLVDWPEGGYLISDAPYPRGEIIVGSKSMSHGYFKQADKTAEEFYDEDGMRWWRSGDIGQAMPDGSFQLIDRKKYLIKLSRGEYVSLSKVESALKFLPLVENVCIHGAPSADYLVALIMPSEKWLETTMQQLNDRVHETDCMSKQITSTSVDDRMTKLALQQMQSFLKERGDFSLIEIPRKVKLCLEKWTPELGLLTPSFKLRRKQIADFYRGAIDKMYSSPIEQLIMKDAA